MFSKSRIVSTASLALLLGVAACGSGDDRAEGELGQRIAEPTTLAIRATSTAAIRGLDARGHDVDVGPLVVTGGSVPVQRIDDRIAVQDLVVHLGDVVADDGVLSGHPLVLTDVTVSLADPMVLEDAWSVTGESARGGKPGQLRLHWTQVSDDGRVVRLAPRDFSRAPIDVALVAEADGSVSARVSTELTGQVMGYWGIELRDFAMHIDASDGE